MTAIFAEDAVPEKWNNFIQINADFFAASSPARVAVRLIALYSAARGPRRLRRSTTATSTPPSSAATPSCAACT